MKSKASLLDRLKTGADDAVETFIQEVEPLLLSVIRRRMGKQIKSELASTDFLQDMWATFLNQSKPFSKFKNVDELQAYLGQVAVNKIREAVRARLTRKRGGHWNGISISQVGESGERFEIVSNPKNTGSQLLAAEELRGSIVEALPPAYKKVLSLMESGHTNQEIAEQLELSISTVKRVQSRIRLKVSGTTRVS